MPSNFKIMAYFLDKIRGLFWWSKEQNAESKYLDAHSRSTSPPKSKRPRLTMEEERIKHTPVCNACSVAANASSSVWQTSEELMDKWIQAKNREERLRDISHMQSNSKIINIEERDLYKTFVLNKAGTSNILNHRGNSPIVRTKSTVYSKHARPKTLRKKNVLKEVIYVDSDSESEVDSSAVQVIESANRRIYLSSCDSDSDVVEIKQSDKCNAKDIKKNSFDENCLEKLKIINVINLDDSDSDIEEVTVLPPLSAAQLRRVNKILKRSPEDEKLITKYKITITRGKIHCLSGLNWLNDEVVNFYMNLIMERSQSKCLPKVYAMNTFFLTKVLSGGQESVKRWTRKVDIFEYDLVPIPYNQNNMHWCLIMIDMKKKAVSYYDSLGGTDKNVLDVVMNYVIDEYFDKKHRVLDISEWTKRHAKNIPQQMNAGDCGVFMCTISEYLCRNVSLTFSQKDMPYFRKKMCLEIVDGNLMT